VSNELVTTWDNDPNFGGPHNDHYGIWLFHRQDDGTLVSETTDGETLARARALAREHGLTAYDAWYLEVALRLALPLATFDAALGTAAERAGVDRPTCV
jgi:predicted nucleic acid-binding protein